MITFVIADTLNVTMLNGGDTRAPAGTVTVAGTEAAPVWELVSDTVTPPAGAGPVNIIVFWEVDNVAVVPLGARFRAAMTTEFAVTVKVAVTVEEPIVALIDTLVFAVTGPALTVNAGDTVAFAGTVIVAGTLTTAGLELVKVMTVAVAIAPLSVTMFRVV
jgi:hypothetical protein